MVMEDALEYIIDYRGKTPNKSDKGRLTLSAKSVRDGHIDYSQAYYISEEEYKRFMVRGFPQVGDVLLTTEAPLGVTARLDRSDIALAQRLLTLRGKREILDTGYLYYYLRSPIGQSKLLARQTGTTVTGIKQAEFRKIEIELPPIGTQKEIASILTCIDQKIVNNKKISDNLLEQVTAYYHDCFDQYEKSDQNIGLLSDIARFKYGTMPKKDKLGTGQYVAFSGYQNVGNYPEKMFTNPQLIIVARGVGGCGDIKYAPANCYLTNLSIAILTDSIAKEDYLFHYLRLHDTKAMNTGSAQPQITVSSLEKYRLPIPPQAVLESFSAMIEPYKSLYRGCLLENEKLSSIRDVLLPKLMSGEIDVSNIAV